MRGRDLNPAAPPLLQRHHTFLGRIDRVQVFADFHREVFAEDIGIAVGFQIQLERFRLDADSIRLNTDDRLCLM